MRKRASQRALGSFSRNTVVTAGENKTEGDGGEGIKPSKATPSKRRRKENYSAPSLAQIMETAWCERSGKGTEQKPHKEPRSMVT